KIKPSSDYPFPLDQLQSLSGSDFQKMAARHLSHPDPTEDVSIIRYDPPSHTAIITFIRRDPGRVVRTGKMPHPFMRIAPHVLLIGEYRINAHGHVTKKVGL